MRRSLRFRRFASIVALLAAIAATAATSPATPTAVTSFPVNIALSESEPVAIRDVAIDLGQSYNGHLSASFPGLSSRVRIALSPLGENWLPMFRPDIDPYSPTAVSGDRSVRPARSRVSG